MKSLMKLFKKKADEREMQEYMRVERVGFWVMFYGVAIVMIVQLVLPDAEPRHLAGELIVLLVGCVVSLVGYIRKGLWSPRFKINVKSNLLFSLAGGVILAGIAALRLSGVPSMQGYPMRFALAVLIQFVFTFALTFGLLTVCAALVKRRRAKLEAEVEDADKN